jgi:hypothetical protein
MRKQQPRRRHGPGAYRAMLGILGSLAGMALQLGRQAVVSDDRAHPATAADPIPGLPADRSRHMSGETRDHPNSRGNATRGLPVLLRRYRRVTQVQLVAVR